jgi:transposase
MVGMARPTLLHLTDQPRQDLLTTAERTNDADYRDACRAILMLGSGQSRAEVARYFGVHPATIGRWAAAYRTRGLDGLHGPSEDHRGRPRKLTTEHLVLIRQTVLTKPKELGYAFTAWTLPRLAQFVDDRLGFSVEPHYLGMLLHRMGLALHRPKHCLRGKRDEQAHDEAKAELADMKEALPTEERIIISQDEAEVHLYPYLVAIWCVVGSPQPEVPTPGKNAKRVVYGGLNLKTGHLTSYWAATKSGSHFVEFLEQLLAAYPDRQILMITDNGSFHHTKHVAAFFTAHQHRLEVKWLPSYCPDLNDIERTWRKLKASHASNFLFNSLDDLAENVQRGIDELNATVKTVG